MARHRYAVLDTYRFFAAIGIVMHHFEANLSPFQGPQTHSLDRVQSLVDFFFVLSGFVLMHTYGDRIRDWRSYGDFLRKRIARIYPLQVATILLCVAIAVFVTVRHIPARDTSLINLDLIPQNLLLVQAWGTASKPGLNFPSWSISAEAFVYLLFPLLAFIISRVGPVRALVIAAACAMTIEAFRAAFGLRPGTIATFDYGMLRAVPTFLAGMAVCRIVEARPARPLRWWVPNTLVFVIISLMMVKAPFGLIDSCYPPLVGLIAMADRGGCPTKLKDSGFVLLGNASFAIYMLHTFVEVACVDVVRRLDWTSVSALCTVAAVGTLVIVLASLISYRFFESPLRRMIGGSGRGIQRRSAAPDSLIDATGG